MGEHQGIPDGVMDTYCWLHSAFTLPRLIPMTEEVRTGQDRTGQDRTGQDRTGHSAGLDLVELSRNLTGSVFSLSTSSMRRFVFNI